MTSVFVFTTEAFPSPSGWRGGPAWHVNGDEAKAWYGSTGGDPHRTRQSNDSTATSCYAASPNQISMFPLASEDVQSTAAGEWGPDWDKILTNLADYPDLTAYMCYGTEGTYTVDWNTAPVCENSTATVHGYVKQGDSSTSVELFQGTSVSSQTTVEKATQLGQKLQVSYENNEIFAGTKIVENFYSLFTDTTGHSHTDTDDTRTTVTETVACPGPANVSVDVSLQTCRVHGQFTVPLTLSGWAWFFYTTRRQGHYECL
ncbi:uncharacterized protein EI90DRAFT_3115476 [Cantharellus anzutake]|uniref:uncharacterized protein n=1 Tax=Cantharellus anzutake TaxID=1750568 RepID=UPI001907B046|nr:uncharacterized protein EI90DRAFT_3115476 [Cantharellus anzutake]KAF8342968.1 hypothetical protein EI90DRAFT_3115476 [Cantharellus anzutake]